MKMKMKKSKKKKLIKKNYRYLDESLSKDERIKHSIAEINFIKNEYEDYKIKTKVEFELISSSLFEISHQYLDYKNKNEMQIEKTKNKNWLNSERLKIFPLDK